MKYERKRLVVEAQQWNGDLKEITITDKMYQQRGVMGYAARLAYLPIKDKDRIVTVRPQDYVVKYSDGKLRVMDRVSFESEFVAKDTKTSNNSKKAEDNATFV